MVQDISSSYCADREGRLGLAVVVMIRVPNKLNGSPVKARKAKRNKSLLVLLALKLQI